MSYNLLAISNTAPDWQKINANVFNPNGPVEMFPIDEGDGLAYLGLSIPASKLARNPDAWEEIATILRSLRFIYNFKVYDLYGGFFVEEDNIHKVKQQLMGT